MMLTASTLIKTLQALLDKHGDHVVRVYTNRGELDYAWSVTAEKGTDGNVYEYIIGQD